MPRAPLASAPFGQLVLWVTALPRSTAPRALVAAAVTSLSLKSLWARYIRPVSRYVWLSVVCLVAAAAEAVGSLLATLAQDASAGLVGTVGAAVALVVLGSVVGAARRPRQPQPHPARESGPLDRVMLLLTAGPAAAVLGLLATPFLVMFLPLLFARQVVRRRRGASVRLAPATVAVCFLVDGVVGAGIALAVTDRRDLQFAAVLLAYFACIAVGVGIKARRAAVSLWMFAGLP